MTDYLDIADARKESGVRLVLSAGTPGPWGEAIKGMLHVKQIPYVRVRQDPAAENAELVEWTGIRNAPQLVAEDDASIHAWADLIYFTEEREPAPPLIPEDFDARVRMFGLINEIAGKGGFAWHRRFALLGPIVEMYRKQPNPALEGVVHMAESYGYDTAAAKDAPHKVTAILEHLARVLEAQQQDSGSPYFIGDQLTALDIYWACFAVLVSPMPDDLCPMPEYLRKSYGSMDSASQPTHMDALLTHRDFIYREHLELPMRF